MKTKIAKEDVLKRLSAYFPADKFDQFVAENQESIMDMTNGRWSQVHTFYKRESDEEYRARVKFSSVRDGDQRYIRTDFRFANKELVIADVITYDGVKISIPKPLQDELRNTGRLKDAVKYVDRRGTQQGVIIAVDQELNRLVFAKQSRFQAIKKLYGKDLGDKQQAFVNGELIEWTLTVPGKREPIPVFAYIDPVFDTIRFKDRAVPQQVIAQEVTEPRQKIEKSEALKALEKQIEIKDNKRTATKKQTQKV